jgi:hypothetical protein
VLDIPVTQPQLQRSGVVTVIGKFKAAGVSEHMRMDREGQLRFLTRPRNHFPHAVGAHRASSLGHEHEAAMVGPLAGELAQSPQFVSLYWMRRRATVLGTPDVQVASPQVDLIPLECNHLRHA